MTTENATSIGKSLRVLLEIYNADKSKPNRKGFLRIRVLINLKDPLATSFLHHQPPKAPAQILYQYERLSDFCYACGRLGHLSFSRPIVPRPPNTGKYGAHLKASPPKISHVEMTIPVRCSLASQTALGMVCLTRHSPEVTQAVSTSSPSQLNLSRVGTSSQGLQTSPINTKPLVSRTDLALVGSSKSTFSSALIEKAPLANLQLDPLISSLMLSQVANIKSL